MQNAVVNLTLDGPPTLSEEECSDCGARFTLTKNFVLDGDEPYAIAFAALHQHGGESEAWIDVILGTFEGTADDERTTFGARVGPVESSAEPAATAVQAATPYQDGPTWGTKLGRQDALAHPRIADFWTVVDFILEADPHVHHHVYGHPQQ